MACLLKKFAAALVILVIAIGATAPWADAGRAVIGPSCLTNLSGQGTLAGNGNVGGAASARALVVVTDNGRIQAYYRTTCALTSGEDLTSFFASTGISATTFVFRPHVLYDRRSTRFFLSSTGLDVSNGDIFLLFAVSTDFTATAWHKYKLSMAGTGGGLCSGVQTGSNWFANLGGVQDKRWLVTGFSSTDGFATLLDIDKTPTLTGAATTIRCFGSIASVIVPPVLYDASSRATLIGTPTTGAGSALSRHDLEVFSGNIALDSLISRPSYNVTAFTTPSTILQPGGQMVYAGGGFEAPSIQTGIFLWNVHTVNVTTGAGTFARWRYYRLRNDATATSTVTKTFTSPSTVAGNNDHLFHPSLATGSGMAGSAMFVTAMRLIPSLTAGNQGNATLLVFEGLNNSAAISDWNPSSVIQLTKFRYADDGQGNACNAVGGCFLSRTATQSDVGTGGTTRAWSFGATPSSTVQFDWRTRAARSEEGPF